MPEKKTEAKKPAAKKPAAKKASPEKAVTAKKKPAAPKEASPKAAVKKAVKSAAVKPAASAAVKKKTVKAPAKAVAKTPVKKAAAEKKPVARATTKKAPVKKAVTKKDTPAKAKVPAKAPAKPPAKKTTKAAVKKASAAEKAPAKTAAAAVKKTAKPKAAAAPKVQPVKPDEKVAKTSAPKKAAVTPGKPAAKPKVEEKPKAKGPRVFKVGNSGLTYTRKPVADEAPEERAPRPRPEAEDRKPAPTSKPAEAKGKTPWKQEERPKKRPYEKPSASYKKRSDDRKPGGSKPTGKPFYEQFKPKTKAIHYKKRVVDDELPAERKRDTKDAAFDRKEPRQKAPWKKEEARNKPTPGAWKSKVVKPDPDASPELIRLNKYISNAGICSRRKADEFIKEGKVSVNGVVVKEVGTKVLRKDKVELEGTRVVPGKKVYILLNKPKDVICTTSDEKGRRTIMDYVGDATEERIYPVGRLDRNSTGLLLITNDGALSQKLAHPSGNISKLYKVTLDKPVTKADFERILKGVKLEEGIAKVDDLAYTEDSKKILGIELHIGWNRVIRRIFETLGYEVEKLDRVLFAGLTKKDLPRGKWRHLTEQELVRLKHFT